MDIFTAPNRSIC